MKMIIKIALMTIWFVALSGCASQSPRLDALEDKVNETRLMAATIRMTL